MSELNPQEVANTPWAFATVKCRDQRLFAALAIAAERRLSEFTGQGLSNAAWAFATVNYQDQKLCAVLARATERRVSGLNVQEFSMALWAFSACESLKDAWSLFVWATKILPWESTGAVLLGYRDE